MMKQRLTSKERRGLVAVAAAALLCILVPFIFRHCSSRHNQFPPAVFIIDNDSLSVAADSRDTIAKSPKGKSDSKSTNGKRIRREKRRKTEKTYPSRSPLDQPCD